MKWFSRWFKRHSDVAQDTEAQEARAGAEERLQQARDQTPAVDDAVHRVRALRHTNNWGPRIKKALSVD